MELAEEALLEHYRHSQGSPPADEPEERTRERIFEWMRAQHWYTRSENLYPMIMNGALPTAGLRQVFLQSKCAAARPSSGYRRLGDLLQARIFDTVFTTNFDRLVPQGAWGQPVRTVMSLSEYSNLPPSPTEPRLIRLHGDFWHHNVLNTEGELERVPGRRIKAAARLCTGSGMIVFGYGGRDRRIMVELFHKNMGKSSFLRNGLYWCVPEAAEIPEMVRTLAAIPASHERRVYIVRISDFDQAIGTIADKLGVQDWWGEYEAAHQAQAIYKELLDLVFQPGAADTSRLPGLLRDVAAQIRTHEAWYIGLSGELVTVVSSASPIAPATEAQRLRNLLFRTNTPLQGFAASEISGPDIPVGGSSDSAYQFVSVWQDDRPLGGLLVPSLPRARDTDHFLMSVTARMMALIHARIHRPD